MKRYVIKEAREEKKERRGAFPFPVIVAAGALTTAAYFLMRRGEGSNYDEYMKEGFSYEPEANTSGS